MTRRLRFASIAEPAWQRRAFGWAVTGLVLGALLMAVAGCAGELNDYTSLANAYSAESLDNLVKRRAEQRDVELHAAAALYCGAVSIGAIERRYTAPEDRLARDRACAVERRLGW